MKIHVRRRHIEKGDRVSSMNCAIALAVHELTRERVIVLTSIIRVGDKVSGVPAIARRFIARFDAGKPVKPFAFVLK
jgi:hypothetical protein